MKFILKGKRIAIRVKWLKKQSRPINLKERIQHLYQAFVLQQFLERNEKLREICLLAHTQGDIVYFGKDVKVYPDSVVESKLPIVEDELPF